MAFFKYINMPVFIISLILGFVAVYYTMPDTRTIYVYPTPENAELLQYRDKTDTCFSLEQTEVKCPINERDIAKIPMQH
jgi:hypothetical protein